MAMKEYMNMNKKEYNHNYYLVHKTELNLKSKVQKASGKKKAKK